jgi:hypothetical protein
MIASQLTLEDAGAADEGAFSRGVGLHPSAVMETRALVARRAAKRVSDRMTTAVVTRVEEVHPAPLSKRHWPLHRSR